MEEKLYFPDSTRSMIAHYILQTTEVTYPTEVAHHTEVTPPALENEGKKYYGMSALSCINP